jgi:hypothetical protein
VAEVFPDWVKHDPNLDMKLLGPQGFEALVVEALRQLTERITALEQDNKRLAQMLEARAAEGAQATSGAHAPRTRRRQSSEDD